MKRIQDCVYGFCVVCINRQIASFNGKWFGHLFYGYQCKISFSDMNANRMVLPNSKNYGSFHFSTEF